MLSSVTTELFVAVVANAYDNYQRQPVLNRNNLPYGPLRPFILWGSAFAFLQIFAGAPRLQWLPSEKRAGLLLLRERRLRGKPAERSQIQ